MAFDILCKKVTNLSKQIFSNFCSLLRIFQLYATNSSKDTTFVTRDLARTEGLNQ